MSNTKKYDIIVIGGGAGGLTCSIGAAKIGKKTLLIERRKIGGECTWAGCVPSKAFIQSSKSYFENKDDIFKSVRNASEQVYLHETPEIIKSFGVDIVFGEASFYDSHNIKIANDVYYGKKIIICTGTSPFIPEIKGLSNNNILTNDNFFEQNKLPKSVVFIGGGVISLELSIPLARLGVKVSILDISPDILNIAENYVRTTIKETLKEYNIDLFTHINIKEIKNENDSYSIYFTQNNEEHSIPMEKVFVTAGRAPNIEALNLDRAGVKYEHTGIIVNDYLQTSKPHIFALGDVVGPFRFSHVAGTQGETIIRNLILPLFPKKYKQMAIPYVIFTDPEYAKVGLLENEAREKFGDNIKIYEVFQKDSERAIISSENKFYLKIITNKGLIVGATVLSMKAGEIANTLQWFYATKTPFRKFASVIQAYPTYGDLLRKISKKVMIDDLLSNPIISLFKKK